MSTTAHSDRASERQTSALKCAAAACLVVYAGWNALHLVMNQFAPSLWLSITGLPCPTTGGTRAITAMAAGDWQASLAWNPLALPMLGLLLATFGAIIVSPFRKKRIALSSRWLHAWMLTLSVAWVIQLVRFATGAFPG